MKSKNEKVVTMEDVERELMKDWRFRFHYYLLWPGYQLLRWRIKARLWWQAKNSGAGQSAEE